MSSPIVTVTSHSTSQRATWRPGCAYIARTGTPCRYSALPGRDHCKYHLTATIANGGRSFSSDIPPQAFSPSNAGHCNRQGDSRLAGPSLAADLLKAAGKLSSPTDVRRVMRKIFQVMVERRLTPKEAGVLCYIATIVLRAHRATLHQQKLDVEAKAVREEEEERLSRPDKITWNVPRSTTPSVLDEDCSRT